MGKNECPYCKEEIDDNAVICKNCGARLKWSKKEMIMSEITSRVEKIPINIYKGPVSGFTAWCYGMYGSNSVLLSQCLEESRGASAIAAMAEKLQGELMMTFYDIIWGGGDIDPPRFEKLVRERFSRPPDK
jgi:hypothetical protein